MKVFIILSLAAAAAFAVPVDQVAYKKQEYKEVEYKEPPTPPKEPAKESVAPVVKYEEPVDKSIYPYVVSRGFPYDYRGFPYLNNEFPHGYPAPKKGYYAPLLAYHPAAAYGPYQGAPAAYAPALHHAPAPVAHAPVQAYEAPVHPAPVNEVTKPKYDSMKYLGKYEKGCGGDGIYYNNLESFILCSNGNPYVQRCAPGTKNQGADHYSYGSSYTFKDLCGVNLVDTGYGPSNVLY